MNDRYPRNESLERFSARRQAWDLETGPRPIPRILIVGSVALTLASCIVGTRRMDTDATPENNPSYTAPAPTRIGMTTEACYYDSFILPIGGSEWGIAEENFPSENPLDVIDRMQNVDADEDGRTMPYPGDTIKVASPGCDPEQ